MLGVKMNAKTMGRVELRVTAMEIAWMEMARKKVAIAKRKVVMKVLIILAVGTRVVQKSAACLMTAATVSANLAKAVALKVKRSKRNKSRRITKSVSLLLLHPVNSVALQHLIRKP